MLLTNWNCRPRRLCASQRYLLDDGRHEQRRPAAAAAASNLLSLCWFGGRFERVAGPAAAFASFIPLARLVRHPPALLFGALLLQQRAASIPPTQTL